MTSPSISASSKQSNSIRILLLDKDSLVRSAFKKLLECQPGLEVIAEGGEEAEALRLAEQEQPDVILLREGLNGLMGLDLIPALMAVMNQPRIILITARDLQFYVQAVKKGAVGVVMINQPPQVLYKAIEKVHAGEVWLDRTLIANILVQKSYGLAGSGITVESRKINQLSLRERDVIVLVGEGLKNQQIAERLFLSEVTVRHHLTSIFRKLGLADRLELVIYAYQNNLARLPE